MSEPDPPPDLDTLKSKWFIPMDGSAPDLVPCQRTTDESGPDALSVSTDGNTVTPQIDGAAYMSLWESKLAALKGSSGAELMHAAWRLEDVKPLGATAPGNNALEDIHDADTAGVINHVDICGNMAALIFNVPSYHWLRDSNGVAGACMDQRFPPTGSNHQKVAVFKTDTSASALVGIDISKARWDTPAHLAVNPDRDATLGAPTHDVGVLVEGPAVGDIEKTFRERWNDATRTNLQFAPVPPAITSTVSAPASTNGGHSVQVLRTYGITEATNAYSWSPRGEFTAWASYLNAIKKAQKYIYIEDQYFYSFDWPPCYARPDGSPAQLTDLVFQLGQAMLNNGVRVVILVPTKGEDSAFFRKYQTYQRDVSVNYLVSINAQIQALAQAQAPTVATPGDLMVASLQNGTGDVMVHSKLMIVDDEFVLVGSTNVGQRSMTQDGELQLGVVDQAGVLAQNLRQSLWAEHSGRATTGIPSDPVAAFTQFQADMAANAGHLKPYVPDKNALYPPGSGSTSPPVGHVRLISNVIDPYYGPPGLR